MKEKEEKKYFQNILIKFDGGKEVHASVPAFVFDEEELENLHITEIKITHPKEMAPGTSFEYIK